MCLITSQDLDCLMPKLSSVKEFTNERKWLTTLGIIIVLKKMFLRGFFPQIYTGNISTARFRY